MPGKGSRGGKIQVYIRVTPTAYQAMEDLRVGEHPRLDRTDFYEAAVELYLEAAKVNSLEPETLRPRVGFVKQHAKDGRPEKPVKQKEA